jgi:hypothetical protein
MTTKAKKYHAGFTFEDKWDAEGFYVVWALLMTILFIVTGTKYIGVIAIALWFISWSIGRE